jgi:hypothetical protein
MPNFPAGFSFPDPTNWGSFVSTDGYA